MSADALDRRLIGLALALGRRNLGLTWPNPSVGAVVADPVSGRILATAATSRGGRPHAEPPALLAAGERARGATLFVSLEPCSHHGRTPPCTDAIIASGVARVVTAVDDPDPRVAGRGHDLLRAAGIEVRPGMTPEMGELAHRGHFTRVRLRRPSVVCKLAMTSDGFAAGRDGARLLVTGEGANARTHLLRAHADAVLVGIGTALADDPRLDVRLPGLHDRAPVRVLLDSRLRLPLASRLASATPACPSWILCADDADPDAERRLTEAGCRVLRVTRGPDGRLDLPSAVRVLGDEGLTRVLCEAGPILADALAAADLIDDLVLIRNARPLGEPGRPALGPNLTRALAGGFECVGEDRVGDDLIRSYERRGRCSPGS